jgi:Domain of unknown function (DUF1707)
MPDPNLRAADTDRQAAAAALGRHLSDGRLTFEEYDERLAKAYAARTYGELDGLFADLPPSPSARPAAPPAAGHATAPAPVAAGGYPARRGSVRAAWASWTTVAVLVTTIWLLSSIAGGFHYFWPIWVVGPWGAVLLSRTLGGGPRGGRARRHC